MKKYLFVLGRNFALSKAELINFCDEVFSDPEKSLFIGEKLRFENPRNIPRSPEQLFLDRLGGTIRFGEILGEFASKKELINTMVKTLEIEEKNKVAFSIFGAGKSLFPEIFGNIKEAFKAKRKKIRIENSGGKNMTSGQIFDRKLLKKGIEFIIWKRGNTFLLVKTVANQNLRNYVLRDRKKEFRDAKMGMLPPKLAQILINLANVPFSENIIDPFCGSGTLNIEAAILGYQTEGSDIKKAFVEGAKGNFQQMSEKFRFEPNTGKFETKDVLKVDWSKKSGVICTEGFLGENFDTQANLSFDKIKTEASNVLKIWTTLFNQLENSKIQKIVFALPCWNLRNQKYSISEKLFAKLPKNFYISSALFGNNKTFLYERDKTFVAREICIIEKR